MAIDVTSTLRRALADLENQRAELDRQISALRGALGVGGAGNTRTAGRRRRRKPMSAAARAAVSKRMKLYWQKRRARKSK